MTLRYATTAIRVAAAAGLVLLAWYWSSKPSFVVSQEFEFVAALAEWTGVPPARLEWPVRKAGHAGLYLILFLILWGAAAGLRRLRYPEWVAFVLVLAAAVMDELHQFFVPGRDGRVSDVMIDVSLPLLLSLVVSRWQKCSPRRER